MAEYLHTIWQPIPGGKDRDHYQNAAIPQAILLVKEDRGVIIHHQKGARLVQIEMTGGFAKVISEYPKNLDGHETKQWLYAAFPGKEIFIDQFER